MRVGRKAVSILDFMKPTSLFTHGCKSCRNSISLHVYTSMRIVLQTAYFAMMGIGTLLSFSPVSLDPLYKRIILLSQCGNGRAQANWAFVEVLIIVGVF